LQSVKRKVKCPACGKAVEWSPQSVFRPFCSARCKGVDFGAWASESYRIAGTTPLPDRDSEDNASPQ
jgi:hypothetical protein